MFDKINSNTPKTQVIIKFSLLLLVLLGYFGYLSWKFDIVTGGLVAALTWSFFVLCTPIADAGFLLDFPIRMILGLRMWMSELCVWLLAITINIIAVTTAADMYQQSFITSLFYKILTHPWPYWGIIAISALGTFLSVRFGDELMDVTSHKDREFHQDHSFKHEIIIYAGVFLLAFGAYFYLVKDLGVDIEKLL